SSCEGPLGTCGCGGTSGAVVCRTALPPRWPPPTGREPAFDAGSRVGRRLQVLAGVGEGVDCAAGLGALAGDQGADVDDALALLAGNAGPVVGVGGVRQVLVLGELIHAGGEQVLDAQAVHLGGQEVL